MNYSTPIIKISVQIGDSARRRIVRLAVKAVALLLILPVFGYSVLYSAHPAAAFYVSTYASPDNVFNNGNLDFSLDATDFVPAATLDHFMPGDSVSRDVTIRDTGSIHFQYAVSADQISGDRSLCSALQLRVLAGTKVIYNGDLLGFQTQFTVFDAASNKLRYIVSLPVAPKTGGVSNRTCTFSFVYHAGQVNAQNGNGFIHTDQLDTTVTTGTWNESGDDNLSPVQDAWINQFFNNQNTNYGKDIELDVLSAFLEANKRSFLKFDFHLPTNTVVNSAMLKLYDFSPSPIARSYEVRSLLANWSEDTITWRNQPRAAFGATDTAITPSLPGWMAWNVLPDVRNFVSGAPNYGWRVGDSKEDDGKLLTTQDKFYSRESKSVTQRPVLEVGFTTPTVSTNHVVINEVYPSPDRFHGVDPQNEWVELYNPTNFAVDVSGWTICNSVGCTLLPKASVVPSKGFAVLTQRNKLTWPLWPGLPASAVQIELGSLLGGTGLDADSDRVVLKDLNHDDVDGMSYGNDISQLKPAIVAPNFGNSLARVVKGYDTDAAIDWVINATPNPGTNPSPDPSGDEVLRFTADGVLVADAEQGLPDLAVGDDVSADTQPVSLDSSDTTDVENPAALPDEAPAVPATEPVLDSDPVKTDSESSVDPAAVPAEVPSSDSSSGSSGENNADSVDVPVSTEGEGSAAPVSVTGQAASESAPQGPADSSVPPIVPPALETPVEPKDLPPQPVDPVLPSTSPADGVPAASVSSDTVTTSSSN